MKKIYFLYVIIFLAVIIFTWFNFERIVLYFELHSPLPKKWYVFNLVNGEVWYAHFAGLNRDVIKLVDVYKLEQYRKVLNQPVQDSETMKAGNFGLNSELINQESYKSVITRKASVVFLNRESVIFWEVVDPFSQVLQSLR